MSLSEPFYETDYRTPFADGRRERSRSNHAKIIAAGIDFGRLALKLVIAKHSGYVNCHKIVNGSLHEQVCASLERQQHG